MATREEIRNKLAQQIRCIERSRNRAPSVNQEHDLHVEGRARSVSVHQFWRHWLIDPLSMRGGLIEWLSDAHGSGSTTLALWGSRSIVPQGLWVVVDRSGEWYAPGLYSLEMDLNQTVLIRPRRPAEVLWSVEQALRTQGVGAVVCEIDHISPAAYRRLQLAAETGGSLGILLRSERVRHQPSWAECRFLVRPLAVGSAASSRVISVVEAQVFPKQGSLVRRQLWVELLRARGQFSGGAAIVELDDAADGRLCLVSEVAAATAQKRAAGA